MNLRAFKANLLHHSGRNVCFALPDGDPIAAEFHVTEVGHVVKKFIDCGGAQRSTEACLLQIWVSEEDKEHRLTAGKLARILDLAQKVVPSDELNVEVEYDGGVVGQYTVDSCEGTAEGVSFQLGNKKTDCLARELCGVEPGGCGCSPANETGKCC